MQKHGKTLGLIARITAWGTAHFLSILAGQYLDGSYMASLGVFLVLVVAAEILARVEHDGGRYLALVGCTAGILISAVLLSGACKAELPHFHSRPMMALPPLEMGQTTSYNS